MNAELGDESVAEWLEAIVNHVGSTAATATNPLFVQNGRGRKQCVASCTLIRVGHRIVVVTAAHALRRGEEYFFGAHDQLIPLSGASRRTAPINKGDPDFIDLAVVLLEPEVAEKIDPDVPAQVYRDMDLLDGPKQRPIYLAVGYPYSRQKSHRWREESEATAYRMLLMRGPLRDYFDLGLDPVGNLILRFHHKTMWRQGRNVVAPGQRGMSGGSIWLLDGFGWDQEVRSRLAGFVTEWHRRKTKRIVATRAHVALQLLVELDASLSSEVGELGFGSGT